MAMKKKMAANEAKLNYNAMYVLLHTLGVMTGHKQKILSVHFDGSYLALYNSIYFAMCMFHLINHIIIHAL